MDHLPIFLTVKERMVLVDGGEARLVRRRVGPEEQIALDQPGGSGTL